MAYTDTLERAGVKIVHHFGGGTYAKETLIPAGCMLIQHMHPHAHLSILGAGRAIVQTGGAAEEFEAPACITIPAGMAHSVSALTDVVWFCCHATGDTDPASVDTSILAGH
jgi:quercetin dioxygenase-like cupin family protein